MTLSSYTIDSQLCAVPLHLITNKEKLGLAVLWGQTQTNSNGNCDQIIIVSRDLIQDGIFIKKNGQNSIWTVNHIKQGSYDLVLDITVLNQYYSSDLVATNVISRKSFRKRNLDPLLE